jgi:putative endonuclease
MVYVYVIRNLSGRHYVGITKDVCKRLKEHNEGKTKTTKAYRPWTFIYIEATSNYVEARKREKYLKSGYGKMWIKKRWPAFFNK